MYGRRCYHLNVRIYLTQLHTKKPSSTHAHEEEEEGFAQTTRSIVWELIPFKVL